MSKRTIEEVDSEAVVNGSVPKAKKKKDSSERKAKQADAALNGVTSDSDVKKDKKKKRKAQKELDSDTPAVNGTSADGDAPEKPKKKKKSKKSKTQEDGESESKEEKKARKAAKKAAKEAKASRKAKSTPTEESAVSDEEGALLPTASAPSGAPTASSGYTEAESLTSLPKSEIDAFLSKHSVSIVDPHSSNLRPIVSFSHLPPHPFDFSSFSTPTPIQAATWPFTLAGHDCIGVAETGSGKTMAFSVPAIRHITSLRKAQPKGNLGVRVVIVSPTRELAMQIHDVISVQAQAAGLHSVCVFGGVPKDPQRQALQTANVIVATPGRLNDLINEEYADLSKVSYVVLDEADRMLDKGFEDDIRRILSSCPRADRRQTLMFTATWPQSIRDLAATFMRSPVKITIGDRDDLRANTRITQVIEVMSNDSREKEQRLLQLLKKHQSGAHKNDRILVFCLYQKEATRVEQFLRRQGFRVAGIHGALSQQQRMQSLAQFKDGSNPLLIATDVAARGLDIPAVKMVINVTFPLTVEDYVHRIGRTGRAGADGLAHTMFTVADKALTGGLVNVLKAAKQNVPEDLMKFGTSVKKKEHSAYGAFYKDTEGLKTATKITFDD